MKSKWKRTMLLTVIICLLLVNYSLANAVDSGGYSGYFAIDGSANTAQGYAESWSYPADIGFQVFASNKSNASNYGAWVALSEQIDNTPYYRYLRTDDKPEGKGYAYVTAGLWSKSYPTYRVDWKVTPLLNKK